MNNLYIPLFTLVYLSYDSPSNLKEAIDWILRVTKKDGGQQSVNGSEQLAVAVEKLLEGVKSFSSELEEKLGSIKQALTTGGNGIINALGEGLKKFKEGIHQTKRPQNNVYKELNSHPNLTSEVPKAGEIFLGCVPMIFSALSYLYWRCSISYDKGGWKNMTFWDSSQLQYFMEAGGYKSSELQGNGATVVTALSGDKGFTELSSASPSNSFAEFLTSLKKQSDPTKHPLYSLNLLASAYFQHHRTPKPSQTTKPPSSIRTMLYWLSGLTITPQFGELLEHINSMFPSGPISVAISGSPEQNEKLSSDDLAGHLVTSCISSFQVLRSIQGRSVSDDPLLHYTYRNSELSYPPSGAGLFSSLSDYTYALQFQLYFLYTQCAGTYSQECGWRGCRFGSEINKGHETQVVSHICAGFKCNEVSGCSHNGQGSNNPCKHNKPNDSEQCGKGSNLSPLHAFLTDNLKGFSLPSKSDPSSPDHLSNHPPGSMCHVKMGFDVKHLRSKAGQGGNIFKVLEPFCGGPGAPLFQLNAIFGCLTKRAPRSLGDIFGFIWHLNDQLFHDKRPTLQGLIGKFDTALNLGSSLKHAFTSDPYSVITTIWKKISQLTSQPAHSASTNHSVLSRSLESMAPTIPFLYQLFMMDNSTFLPGGLFELKGIAEHSGHSTADLTSLYSTKCNQQEKNCGPYLYPLTHSDGATYAPRHASSYLSWVLYLTDDLQSWFQDMLDEFKDIDCRTSGCKGCNCESGQHGNPSSCDCESVVHCGGTLPLLYRHGFRNYSPLELMGGRTASDNSKRSCSKFSQQLSNVLSPDAPLATLLESIDSFLYAIRWEFFSKLSGFWTMYICIIPYTFFFLLDTLHLRSHLKLTSSHMVPPLALPTSGTPLPVTKLSYYMP
ncbi:variant erythrocyte surface antigen-1 family protein [Babesia caballi]|uniref:Variant erythrocyte surface antigen-1 family protein n=1 Tax=Babesia caballi TaxID=5871 RepID=A0AAV4LND7_BABCB|nr:variant erythrocyte surface antigen-1 family protein [Babesia caballi]